MKVANFCFEDPFKKSKEVKVPERNNEEFSLDEDFEEINSFLAKS